MKSLLLAILLFACSAFGGELIAVESVKDLSNGFRLEDHAEVSTSTFESIAHFRYLFYNDKKLGHCGFVAISPSKRLALYQEGITGHIYIFDALVKENHNISNEFTGLVKKIFWNDTETVVSVHYYDGKLSREYKLP